MFPGKKKLLSESLARMGVADALAGVFPGRGLMVLAYHRVLDIGAEDDYPADPELISATPRDFETQMSFVRRHFNVIRFAQVIDAMDRGVAQCPVDLDGVEQLGQRERLGHLDPHPRRARGSRLDQPQPGPLTQVEELRLRGVLRSGLAVQRAGRLGREVPVIDLRRSRRGATVAGVNDDSQGMTIETRACINVHRRLNVGTNGCAVP